jgi:hypothetical protein
MRSDDAVRLTRLARPNCNESTPRVIVSGGPDSRAMRGTYRLWGQWITWNASPSPGLKEASAWRDVRSVTHLRTIDASRARVDDPRAMPALLESLGRTLRDDDKAPTLLAQVLAAGGGMQRRASRQNTHATSDLLVPSAD